MKLKPPTMKDKHVHFFKDQEPVQKINQFMRIILGISFLCSALILIFALQFEQIFPRYHTVDFKLYETAPYDLVPDRDILWVDEEKTENKREEAERRSPTVFQIDEEKTRLVLEKYSTFKDYVLSKKTNGIEPKKELLFHNLGLNTVLSGDAFAGLLEMNMDDLKGVLARAEMLLLEAMNNGVFSFTGIDRDLLDIKRIDVAREISGSTITSERPLDEIITRQSLSTWVLNKTASLKLTPRERERIETLVSAFAEENCRYDPATTLANRKNAREAVQPIREIIREGFPIVGKGQPVTKELYSKVLTLRKNTVTTAANKIVSTLFFLVIIFGTAIFLLGKTLSGRVYTKGEVFFLLLLMFIYLVSSVLIYRLLPLEGEYPLSLLLPTAAITVFVTIIISPYAGIVFSFLLAAITLLVQNEMSTFLFALFSGIAGTAAVTRVEKRIDLVKAGFMLFLFQGFLMVIIGAFYEYPPERTVAVTVGAGLNGFFSFILSIGFLPLFEHLLNVPTRFRLMELSDINVAILKKMLVLAPGTYTHSINVANLSESASLAIGANPLLARVGAYYHDIGKIDQPEYFIENQDALNKHDFLKPSLSAAVIKSHVKIGVEKAKELDLPPAVIEIIGQHHGKGLISYFFNRARAENSNGDEISPEDYSYQGKRPQTKEAAIVMLADAVEAASRSLKKPTVAKIEKLVWQIMIERFHSEELLECTLTLHDLEIIKRVFVQIVQGHLHQRIEYPKVAEAVR